MNIKRILVFPNYLRAIPALLFYAGCRCDIKDKIRKDVARNSENKCFSIFELTYCLVWNKPFRNILYFRFLEQWPLVSRLIWFCFPPRNDIEISGIIGGGLVIWHGYGTVIACHSIGENCSIWQGVTIGNRPQPGDIITKPIIGNNVNISANAVVIGGITVGDNVTIGAGCIAFRNIPSDVNAVGNPARIITKNERVKP